jgi:hypothetical protein
MGSAYNVFVGKHEGKRSVGKPRSTYEDNIKIHHKEVGCGGCGMSSSDGLF